MGLLVLDFEGFASPAAREHQLETNTISAVGIEVSLVRHEVSIERTFRGLGVVEAVEAQSGLLKEGLGVVRRLVPQRLLNVRDGIVREVAVVGIASNHLETRREGRQGGVTSVRIKKVVSSIIVSKNLAAQMRKINKQTRKYLACDSEGFAIYGSKLAVLAPK